MGLVSELMDRYKRKVARFVLVPSDGGKFELKVGGRLVYSKLETGRFPENAEIVKALDPVIAKR